MKKRNLEEMVKEARKTKFSMPPEVTSNKVLLPERSQGLLFIDIYLFLRIKIKTR